MNLKIIETVKELKFDEIIFPEINYESNIKLNLNSTTLLAAYTTISKRVEEFIKEIEWNSYQKFKVISKGEILK